MGEGDSDLAMLDEATRLKHRHNFGTATQDAAPSLADGIAVVLFVVLLVIIQPLS